MKGLMCKSTCRFFFLGDWLKTSRIAGHLVGGGMLIIQTFFSMTYFSSGYKIRCLNSSGPMQPAGQDFHGHFCNGSHDVRSYLWRHCCRLWLVSMPLNWCQEKNDLLYGNLVLKLKMEKLKKKTISISSNNPNPRFVHGLHGVYHDVKK